jgi:hypothetical protein
MDAYLWTLLFSGLTTSAQALQARPAPPAVPPASRIERLVEAHRGLAQPLRLIPVAAPAGPLPRPGCAPANG